MRRASILAVFAAFFMLAGQAFADCTAPDIRSDIAAQWKDGSGNLRWPPNDGAAGAITPVVLTPGMVIDRYGCEWGNFFSPRGAAFAARALPYVCATSPYFTYRVVRPVVAWTAKAAPWFDQKGGATQFQTDASVSQLLADGVIETVAAERPACG
ncbi:Rhs family protein [Paramagnetospirillum magnetotacticum MS-1]|uniref:Rhs family protein n=1 Tax=Paramagnetospirillum magnetotacticum MS-1 TaxID=272627 RepID=A0A0C2YSM6_PARME|nr:TNT domain-containing protein [Paramagnetospirillum magnetotacticum]KIL98123.1 Rhs family protein [Paramagnetospirillum magnetotacticum MS-1]